MQKKVGVITFHDYDNYGALLQSYALQNCLKDLGANPEIIDYACDYIRKPFALKRLKNKGVFNYIYGVIGYICYLPRAKKFNAFRKRISYSEHVTKETIDRMDGKYDVYIAGSDQIWDYHLTNFDKAYFLNFVTKGKKCSYAASIGEHLPSTQYQQEYTRLLQGFDHILMRESYGADVVNQLIGEKPDCSCDPTLLLTAKQWEPLMAKSKKKKDYILVYQLGVNPSFVNFVKRLKKQTGLPVVYVPFPLVGFMSCNISLAPAPEEWLRLFHDAKYVVTDSFHGAVFSILFHKPFFVKVDGHHVNKRVEELLTRLNMTDRIIRDDLESDAITAQMDYTYADKQLEIFRSESMERLSQLLD